MKIWKDITSFHAIGRCIDQKARSREDVCDFLQFCTELIYCDSVQVTTHGPAYMAEITKSIRQKLIEQFSVPADFINLYSYPREEEIKTNGAIIGDKVYKHLYNNDLNPIDYQPIHKDQFPTGYAGKKIQPTIDIIRDVVVGGQSVSSYSRELNDSLKDDTYNYSLFVLLNKPEVVEKLKYSFGKHEWQDHNIEALLANCKVIINQTLSSQQELIYAPSYLRSQSNRMLLNENLNRINRWSNDFEADLKNRLDFGISSDLNVPSAIKMFLLSGELSIQGVLDKALEARFKLVWLRTEVLTKVNTALYSKDDAAIANLMKELKRCENEILYNFELVSRGGGVFDKIVSALTVELSGGMAVNLQGIRNAVTAVKTMLSDRDYTLATHLISTMKRNDSIDLESKIMDLFLGCKIKEPIKA
ncbi:hypothetical protein [Vibrio parahaemolyticus]|uniref:hypothetical protein n=2 Tax=Vibrio parahaemolyticus TaxID=670 RepID=UPI00111DA690|nr:hypothetical protein [Vibrio parahaemolyticus]TPA32200.1 hypothetical protein DXJ85_25010 [Vibrio parahaemolyticus]